LLPLYDENPSSTRPWVNYALIALNVAMFLYELSLPASGLKRFFYAYSVVPHTLVTHLSALGHGVGVPPIDFLPILSAMFMHAGWLHLGGNMLFLYIFGDNVEDRLGHGLYLLFYLFAGVIAALTQSYAAPLSTLPSLGASGAIGGVLGVYMLLYPKVRVRTLVFLGFFITFLRIPALVFLGIWFLLQSVQGVLSLHGAATQGGVAFWAHIGGFLSGLVLGLILRALPPKAPPRSPFADRWYSNRI
jgi:membrane associated rhomboid family serine protease